MSSYHKLLLIALSVHDSPIQSTMRLWNIKKQGHRSWVGWVCTCPPTFLQLTFIENEHLPIHFLVLPAEQFLVLPTHFGKASYTPEKHIDHLVDCDLLQSLNELCHNSIVSPLDLISISKKTKKTSSKTWPQPKGRETFQRQLKNKLKAMSCLDYPWTTEFSGSGITVSAPLKLQS